MTNNGARFATTENRKSQGKGGWLSLLTFGVVVLIFALVAYQIGHEVAGNIKVATDSTGPASLPVETQTATGALPTNPVLPPTIPAQAPAEVALPPSNKPGIAVTPTPAPVKSALPAPTAKPAPPAPAQQKPVAPAVSNSKPRPTTKPS